MTILTDKQKAFCDTKLKTIMANTGIRGVEFETYPSATFIVRDTDNSFVDSFGDLTEAIECLLCSVHNFRSVEPDIVDAVIHYLDAERFLR